MLVASRGETTEHRHVKAGVPDHPQIPTDRPDKPMLGEEPTIEDRLQTGSSQAETELQIIVVAKSQTTIKSAHEIYEATRQREVAAPEIREQSSRIKFVQTANSLVVLSV
jgi:hypothetical protein